jgi:fatty-acyl-CoA synthase|tara:strand:- start:2035 stop:2919 length:885 start_codon:yes stop_codon:yes gene_type:complete
MPDLTLVRVAPPGIAPVEGVIDFFDAIGDQPADRLIFNSRGHGDDVAAYFHTGGTTGVPKLAAHSHNGQLTAAFGCAAMMNLGPDDVLTGTSPMFHVAGTILMGISTFLAGSEIVLMSPSGMRNPAMVTNFWQICERYGDTLAFGVPTAIGAITGVPLSGVDISSVRGGLTGAASLRVAVREKFEAVTGTRLNEIYGMTEASGIISCKPFEGEGGSVIRVERRASTDYGGGAVSRSSTRFGEGFPTVGLRSRAVSAVGHLPAPNRRSDGSASVGNCRVGASTTGMPTNDPTLQP